MDLHDPHCPSWGSALPVPPSPSPLAPLAPLAPAPGSPAPVTGGTLAAFGAHADPSWITRLEADPDQAPGLP